MAKKSKPANKSSVSGSFDLATQIPGASQEQLEANLEKARQGYAKAVTNMKEENRQLWSTIEFPLPPALQELKDSFEARLDQLIAIKDDVAKIMLAEDDYNAAAREHKQILDGLLAVSSEYELQRSVEKIVIIAGGVTKDVDAPAPAAFRKKNAGVTP